MSFCLIPGNIQLIGYVSLKCVQHLYAHSRYCTVSMSGVDCTGCGSLEVTMPSSAA